MKKTLLFILLISSLAIALSCSNTKQGKNSYAEELKKQDPYMQLMANPLYIDAICQSELTAIQATAEMMVHEGLYIRRCYGIFKASINIRGKEIPVRKIAMDFYRYNGINPIGLKKEDVQLIGRMFFSIQSKEINGIISQKTEQNSAFHFFQDGQIPLVVLNQDIPACKTK